MKTDSLVAVVVINVTLFLMYLFIVATEGKLWVAPPRTHHTPVQAATGCDDEHPGEEPCGE